MIFPQHRIVAQLIKDGDMTPDEAVLVGRRMQGLQGTIAPEDFFHLGHVLAMGGLSQPATVGQQNQIGCAIIDQTRPVETIIEDVIVKNDMDLYIVLPAELVNYASSAARFRDMNFVITKPTFPIPAPLTVMLSRTSAVVTGQFVGPISAGQTMKEEIVLREGFGIALVGAVNIADKVFIKWREKDLRIR